MNRSAQVTRRTKETDIEAALTLSGGEVAVDTGIGFFDHMMTALAFHAGWGLTLRARGDLRVDFHHTVEDCGIVLGQALRQALSQMPGIERFADTAVPMDEALALACLDVGGRPFLRFDAPMPQQKIGEYDACLTVEFWRAFVTHAGVTLHLSATGDNAHHITEAVFKAAARALRLALRETGRVVPSTKGVL